MLRERMAMIPASVIEFFSGLWTLRDKTGATPAAHSVYFFDELPGEPVVYCNYCELGPIKNSTIGVTLWIRGEKQVIDLGLKFKSLRILPPIHPPKSSIK